MCSSLDYGCASSIVLTSNVKIFFSPILLFFPQVDRLVILHEEAEDGNAMPDLSRPVGAVSNAVANLIKVQYLRTALRL